MTNHLDFEDPFEESLILEYQYQAVLKRIVQGVNDIPLVDIHVIINDALEVEGFTYRLTADGDVVE